MTVSIKDVAKEAGVSISAASKALNDYPDIGMETRRRIKTVAKEMGYVPNRSARILASKKKKDVAILISGFLENAQMDISYKLMKGANRYAIEHDMYAANYATDPVMQKQKKLIDFCHEYSLSGVMLFGLRMEDPYVEEAQNLGIPCVSVDLKIKGNYTATVRTDDCRAFEEITEYVLQHNHKKLILMYGRKEAEVAHERYKGFCNAVKRYKDQVEQVYTLYSDFQEEQAYLETRKFLAQYGKEQATAFLCMSDVVAMGVYRAVMECGYSVPADFSVTGFDGMDFIHYVQPKLTTVDQNFYGKGYEAGKLLERLLQGEHNLSEIVTPYKLCEGASVRAL